MFQAKFQIAGNILEPPFLDVAKVALLWQKDGPHIVLKFGSSWILIKVPRNVQCKISHCWVYPLSPFPRNGQDMALYGQEMVLQIDSSWILINVPRDAPCQISES